MKTHLFLFFLLLLLSGSVLAQNNKASLQLTAAIYEEEVTGNLDKAVELYLNILKKYPDDRPIAAKTLYHLGLVNEKMGKQKANEYFTRLVNTYPDQTEVVTLAKAKLKALGGSASSRGLVTRRILTDASDVGNILSSDGKFIRGIDWETSGVNEFNIAVGENKQIANISRPFKKIQYSQYRQQVLSPDGKQIAYDSRTGWDNGMLPQLYVRNLDGSGQHSLYTGKSREDSYILPLDWSPDGASILALRRLNPNKKDEIKELLLISASDSSKRVLTVINADYPLMTKTRFSPDGKFIAYSAFCNCSSVNGDIFLIDSDGRNETVIASHPAEDQLLAWTPDGKRILLLSDRSGTWDIWAVRISKGKQQGEPELLKKDYGYDSEAIGITAEGSLYYKTYSTLGSIYSGEVNIETGDLLVTPELIKTRYAGAPSGLAWSPDGKTLLYISRKGYFSQRAQALTLRSITSGEEQFLKPPLDAFGWPSWSPDGKSIISVGFSRKDEGIFRINTETSETTRLAEFALAPKLFPDGKILLFVKDGGQIMKKQNLETGEETQVAKTFTYNFDLSPDGLEVVLNIDTIIKILPLNEGEPRVLNSAIAKGSFDLKWMSDGKYIIVRQLYANNPQIWSVPTKGGTPILLNISVPKLDEFTLNPDNRRFVCTTDEGIKEELWVMENFLLK